MEGKATLPLPVELYEGAALSVVSVLESISARRKREYDEPSWMISWRVKKADSIEHKIRRKKKEQPFYDSSNMTDLVGVRVIVESLACAMALARFLRAHKLFPVRDMDSEEFVISPRVDGYRAIHMVLEVTPPLPGRHVVLLELQIRTMLQHQWSLLSNAEFYKSAEDIPPTLLDRMRALSSMLHLADLEADQLRRGRVLDECSTKIRRLLREQVLERLSPDSLATGEDPSQVGNLAIILLEMDTHVRRALVSDGDVQRRAFDAIASLMRAAEAKDKRLAADLTSLSKRIMIVTESIPRWV